MIISLNWIKEFVNLDGIEVEELVKRFGLSTAEVESVQYRGKDIENVFTAQIKSVKNHPNSEHLHILSVDDGSGEIKQVVCGAPNVREGMKIFFARVGGNVCGNKIKVAKLAGVESYGMCCGGNELGIETDTTGIVELDENTPLGVDIKDLLPVEDVLIEVDNKSLTNRPDLWGHYGIAREFAAIFKRELKPLTIENLSKFDGLKPVSVKVETKNCFRYSALSVENISKKVSTPLMKLRLNYCGMRDLNLLADLTNYVMLEVGQPMHAFDGDIVKGITVIETDKTIKMETLEHEIHEIEKNTIVICDENRQPVAIAGVKGGLKSGISPQTNKLLIESACFDSSTIRKASRKIGLVTDASLRYEKSLDPELCKTATARILYLLESVDSGCKVTSSFTDVYNFHYPVHKIETDATFISRRGGVKVSADEIQDVLVRLGFSVNKNGDKLEVIVPSYRGTKDVSIREDLVEEVFRMYGYDNIKSSTMSMPLKSIDKIPTHEIEYQIKHSLAEIFNLNEVHSYVWNYEEFNKSVGIKQNSILHLVDSSKSGQSGLRTMLLPTLLKIVDENKNKFDDIGIFEIGRTFDELDENNLVKEKKKLAIAIATDKQSDREIYFKLKQIVEFIVKNIVHTSIDFVSPSENEIFHPINSCKIVNKNVVIGEMGVLYPEISNKIDKRKKFAVLELDVNKLISLEKIGQQKIVTSKYQSVALDFNFVGDKNLPYSVIENTLKEFKCNYIMEYSLKDVYQNEKSLPGKISYTCGITITPKTKTLETADIDKFSKRLIDTMREKGFELRA